MAQGKGSLTGAVLAVVGGVGVLGVMGSDVVAVAGRHAGAPFLGSIEISQAFVVLLASASIALASLRGQHAAVDLLTARLSPSMRRLLERVAALLACAFLLAVASASIWIAAEHWSEGERTELLGLPLSWHRLVWIAAVLFAAVASAVSAFSARGRDS